LGHNFHFAAIHPHIPDLTVYTAANYKTTGGSNMRDVFKEYRQGLISWDEAFFIANNNAAACSGDTDFWADQMDSLGCDAAVKNMEFLGYKRDEEGVYLNREASK